MRNQTHMREVKSNRCLYSELSSKFLFMLLVVLAITTTSSCSLFKKKIPKKDETEAQAELKKITDAKAQLNALINNNANLSIEEREKILQDIKNLNITDSEVQDLIRKAEKKLADDKRIIEEEKKVEIEVKEVEVDLNRNFREIAGAANFDVANAKIAETMKLFDSDNSWVLVIISEVDGQKDYDEPTSIKKYLEKIKDTRRYESIVATVKKNDAGKITRIELRKK